MSIKQIYQPVGSRTCGQHCVAMITGQDVNYLISEVFKSKGSTRTKQLISALSEFSFISITDRLQLTGFGAVYHNFFDKGLFIVKVYWTDGRRFTHWMVVKDGKVYCPGYGTFECHNDRFRAIKGRITSFIQIVDLSS